jgi:hypothetical protein
MWMHLRTFVAKVFSREVLFDGSLLFRSAVQGPQRASLICFTGRLNGMFMANCKFLDLLGDHPIDIVMNSTESGTFGQWNLDGAGSFYGSLMKLKGALRALGIPTVAYTGTSAGGGPAVYAAASDPGTSAILFGGRFYLPGRIIPLAQAGTAFEPFCEGWRGAAPKIHNIYGALQPTDCKNDEHLHALVPSARSYPLANDRSHNPMVTLSMRKHLRPVMDLLAQAAHGIDVNFDLVTQA